MNSMSLSFSRLRLPLLISTVLLLLPAGLTDAQTSSVPPPSGDVRMWKPTVVSDTLPNGLRYFFTRVNELPLCEVNVVVDAGMNREGENEHGASYAVTHLLLRGSEKRSGEMVESFLEEQGSVVVPYAHYDYAQLYAKALSKNFQAVTEVLADAVIAPKFEENAVLVLKQQASRLAEAHYSAGELATAAVLQRLCGDGVVLARRLQPSGSEIEALSRATINAFHQRHYQPQHCTVIVTGNLDAAFVRTVLQEHFGSWRRGTDVPRRPLTVPSDDAIVVLNDTSNTKGLAFYRIGVPALRQNDPRFATLVLLNNLLGEGQDSRLRSLFWQRRTVSSTFSSNVAVSSDCAYLLITGSASPLQADSVLLLLREDLRALATDGPSAEDLEARKKALLKDRAVMFAANRTVQSVLKEAAVYGESVEQALGFAERVEAVTPADVRALAAELFATDRQRIVIAGHGERLRNALRAQFPALRVIDL